MISGTIITPGRYELAFDVKADWIFTYLLSPGTYPAHQRWVDIDSSQIPCYLEGKSMSDVIVKSALSQGTQLFSGGLIQQKTEPKKCTCGSYSNDHWADCGLKATTL